MREVRRGRDAWVPLGLAVVGAAEMALMRPAGWPAAVAVEVAASALLVRRRTAALWVAPLAGSLLLLMPWIGPQLDDASAPILYSAVVAYSLGRWVADYRGLYGVAVVLAVYVVDYVLVDTREHGIGDVVFVLALVAPPYAFGRVTRHLADQAELLRANEDLVRRAAARDERHRIARELHDVVAHSVSAMVVQTAAAQDLVRADPERAEAVLADVAATGRQALAETGRLLHVLRDTDDELGITPAPGLAEVPGLVERFRGAGLAVELDLVQDPPALPPGVDVSAYRIVEEALTNALRHGAGRTAWVRVAASDDGVVIRAGNPTAARPDPAPRAGTGLGLLGIGERVSVLGGSLAHGTAPDGSFVLTATLPVTPWRTAARGGRRVSGAGR